MLLLRLLIGLIMFGGLYVTVSQIVIPAIKGRALFPIFRKQSELEAKLIDINQTTVENQLQQQVTQKLEQLNTTKGDINE